MAITSLVPGNIRDWNKVFEVRRVLKKSGTFIFPAPVPLTDSAVTARKDRRKPLVLQNYFDESLHYFSWKEYGNKGGLETQVPEYHKIYETIIE